MLQKEKPYIKLFEFENQGTFFLFFLLENM